MIPTHATKNRVRYRYYTAGFDADLTAIVRRVPSSRMSGKAAISPMDFTSKKMS